MLTVRDAEPGDLPAVWRIRHRCDFDGIPDPPPAGEPPPYLDHIRRTGRLVVAEAGGVVICYAGIVTRGDLTYLADLFVDPERQSGGAGQMLLRNVLPVNGGPRCTLASIDPRAQALYTRSGMTPLWPNMLLATGPHWRRSEPEPTLAIDVAAADDPALREWLNAASGGSRDADLGYWLSQEAGVALWVRHGREPIGLGIVRFAAALSWQPEMAVIGPVAVRDPEAGAEVVAAIVAWTAQQAAKLEVSTPGPHPALPHLLSAGWRITYVETYCASDPGRIDPVRYIGSGGDLF